MWMIMWSTSRRSSNRPEDGSGQQCADQVVNFSIDKYRRHDGWRSTRSVTVCVGSARCCAGGLGGEGGLLCTSGTKPSMQRFAKFIEYKHRSLEMTEDAPGILICPGITFMS